MALSKLYTAGKMWIEAVRDLKAHHTDDFEKFRLINRAQEEVIGQVYDLVAQLYMTESAALTVTGDKVSIAALKIMAGHLNRCILTSSATVYTEPKTMEELIVFRASAQRNKNRIAWTIDGDNAEMRKGALITSYATVKLQYPRVPTQVAIDADFLDVPDGAAVALVLSKLKALISLRIGEPVPDETDKRILLIQSLYHSFDREVANEVVKEKVEALK